MRSRTLPCLVVSVFVAFATPPAEGFQFRIVNGRKASTEEFPYQVALEVKGRQWCGGSIISHNFVLTAGHCVKWAEKTKQISSHLLLVRAGHDVFGSGGTVHPVAKIIVHEHFVNRAPTDKFDIALLKVATPFRYSDRVQPIRLATKPPLPGQMSWVTGYGKQEYMRNVQKPGRHLMAVELPIISLFDCRNMLPSEVADDMICAGGETGHQDSCRGDSGGPLSVDGDLAGIVAWGIGCGREGYPGVYTSVAHYYEWIIDKISEC